MWGKRLVTVKQVKSLWDLELKPYYNEEGNWELVKVRRKSSNCIRSWRESNTKYAEVRAETRTAC